MPVETALGRATRSSSSSPIRIECNIALATDSEDMTEGNTRLHISRLTKLSVREAISALLELHYADWDIRYDVHL